MFSVDLLCKLVDKRVKDLIHSVQTSTVKSSLGGFLEHKEASFPASNMPTVEAKDNKSIYSSKLLGVSQDSLLSGFSELELAEVSHKGLKDVFGWVD